MTSLYQQYCYLEEGEHMSYDLYMAAFDVHSSHSVLHMFMLLCQTGCVGQLYIGQVYDPSLRKSNE